MSIHALDPPTSTTLRSAIILPSFPQILSELLQNSLDAQATQIGCYIDLTKGNTCLRVEDNGCGIGKNELAKIGKRFRTSKTLNQGGLGSVGSYGYRGEALASIASLSLLDITTQEYGREVNAKIIKQSKLLFEGPSPNRYIPGNQGTTVAVREIFHSLPVRRTELEATRASIMMSQLKKVVESLALGKPDVSWEIWEERNIGNGGVRKILSISGTTTYLEVFKILFGKALVHRVQDIRVSSGNRRVIGFISISGDVSKAHQHLYVNGFPIDRGDIHAMIAVKFANSKFASLAAAGEHDGREDYPNAKRSPRRLERHPVYVLDVRLPSGEIDVSYEPRKGTMGYKNTVALKNLLSAVINEFLSRNGFGPVRAMSSERSPTKKSFSVTSELSVRPLSAMAQLSPRSVSSLRPDTTKPCPASAIIALPSRTSGSPTPQRPTSTDAPPACQSVETSTKRRRLAMTASTFTSSPRIGEKGTRKSEWIDNLLAGVGTGVFPLLRQPLHLEAGSRDQECAIPKDAVGTEFCGKHSSALPTFLPPSLPSTTSIQFSKSALAACTVLGQVDRKFIAAVVGCSSPQPVLSLVDQHAADERVSVEKILLELCEAFLNGGVESTNLSTTPPPMVILSRSEALVLVRGNVTSLFRRWGIILSLPAELSEGDYVQVMVEAVPTVLLSRLGKKDATEMTRLLRGYLPVIEGSMGEIDVLCQNMRRYESGSTCIDSQVTRYQGDWGEVMRFMPKEMLELANSKACRNAIMFEDRLDHDQCTRLVQHLAETKFPFMCAHGRPSMVPLVVMSRSGNRGVKRVISWEKVKAEIEEGGKEASNDVSPL